MQSEHNRLNSKVQRMQSGSLTLKKVEEHTAHCMLHTAAVCRVRCVPSSQLCGTVELYLGRWMDGVMAKWITGWMTAGMGSWLDKKVVGCVGQLIDGSMVIDMV